MSKGQMFIPIVAAASTATACSTGDVSLVGGSCSAASSCSSGGSCSSGSALVDSNDPSAKLAQEGWILRTSIGEPRLSELAENYRNMGYKVHVEHFGAVRSDASVSVDGESCTTCFDSVDRSVASQAWGSIYVRPGQAPDRNDELF